MRTIAAAAQVLREPLVQAPRELVVAAQLAATDVKVRAHSVCVWRPRLTHEAQRSSPDVRDACAHLHAMALAATGDAATVLAAGVA